MGKGKGKGKGEGGRGEDATTGSEAFGKEPEPLSAAEQRVVASCDVALFAFDAASLASLASAEQALVRVEAGAGGRAVWAPLPLTTAEGPHDNTVRSWGAAFGAMLGVAGTAGGLPCVFAATGLGGKAEVQAKAHAMCRRLGLPRPLALHPAASSHGDEAGIPPNSVECKCNMRYVRSQS